MIDFIKNNIRIILLLPIALLVTVVLASFVIIQKESSNIYGLNDPDLPDLSSGIDIGIVFGNSVGIDEPLPIVKNRLDTAKQLIDEGHVKKLILSGDNRLHDYDEPAVMYNYLVNEGVSPTRLQKDPAGLSTYETCERAQKIFGVNEAVLISESTHLPRAIFTCNHFGVYSIGVKSDKPILDTFFITQYSREILARSKALFNIYFIGEDTVLGEPININ